MDPRLPSLPLLALLAGAAVAADPAARARELHYRMAYDSAAPWFDQAVRRRPQDLSLAILRAENLRRAGRWDEALEATSRVLADHPCEARALAVASDTWNPNLGNEGGNHDSAWSLVRRAWSCDSAQPDVWNSLWVQARRNRDLPLARSTEKAMARAGYWTPAMMARARLLLAACPPRAFLLVLGDADTYPLFVLQSQDEFRQDVAVLNVDQLADSTALLASWTPELERETGIRSADLSSLAERASGGFVAAGDLLAMVLADDQDGPAPRPVAALWSVEDRLARVLPGRIRMHGPLLHVEPRGNSLPDIDLDSVEAWLRGFDPAPLRGPALSPLETSPVLRSRSPHPAAEFAWLALRAAQGRMEEGSLDAAAALVDRAEAIDRETSRSPDIARSVATLRSDLAGRRRTAATKKGAP